MGPARPRDAPAPVALLTLVPFAAAGRGGILGVGFNNDMAAHLLYAEVYRSEAAFRVTGLLADYPFGPHALAATLAQGLGTGVEASFGGLSAALPVLLAWTALGTLRSGGLLARAAAATLAGGGFLVVSYYAQGAFKEVAQTLLLLGIVVALMEGDLLRGRLRWVPVALILAGTLCVYSFFGLAWTGGLLAVAFAVAALRRLAGGSRARALCDLRAELVPIALAAGVLLVAVVPQLPRLAKFFERSGDVNATGIDKQALGNLAGRIPLWEAFGVWDNPDFRFAPVDPFAVGAWTAFVAALALTGLVLALRRGEWALVMAAFTCLAIWAVSDRTQSPYVAAKALVVLSPLVLLLALRPLVGGSGRDAPPPPGWWQLLSPLLALVLVVVAVDASIQSLRRGPVGPSDHARELRSLRPAIDGRPTLFLCNDDFIEWELAAVPVTAPVIGSGRLPLRPAKAWQPGQALDVDVVEPAALNAADWVITTRDPAASAMPPQLRLVRTTRSYALWRRTGTVAPRHTLAEGDAGGAILDCDTRAGRAIARRDGIAMVAPPSAGVAVPALAPGTSVGVRLKLRPGVYDVSTPYTSPGPISITVGSLQRVMPANLDRAGPRYAIGRITVRPGTPFVQVGLYATRTRLTSPHSVVPGTTIVATPVGGRRSVALRRACGKLVDSYEPGRART